MLKIIDKYILKRYLATFVVMLLLFIPIGIVIDVAEKINKILESKVPFKAVAIYYLDFTIYFANLLFPIFLFLSVIWFTSKLANNTEIIAIFPIFETVYIGCNNGFSFCLNHGLFSCAKSQ
jgi:lipopolysaccharide export system permease protein